MRIGILVLYFLAAAVGCSFAGSSGALIAWIVSAKPDHSDGMTAFGDLVGVVMLLFSFAVHGFLAVLFVAAAQFIRLWARKRLPT